MMKYLLLTILFLSTIKTGAQNSVLSCDKMNTIYVGLKNPVSIAVAGVKQENLIISCTNHTTIIDNGNGEYFFVPQKSGENCLVQITSKDDKGILQHHGTKVLRIKNIPMPTLLLGEKNFGIIDKEIFKTQTRFQVVLENFDFNVQWKIISFEVHTKENTIAINGDELTKEVINLLINLPPCSELTFTKIKLQANNSGSIIDAKDLSFLIK